MKQAHMTKWFRVAGVKITKQQEALAKGILQLLNKIAPALLIIYYLLFERFPGNGTILIFNTNNLMNGLVNLPLIVRSQLNSNLIQQVFQMTEIA